MSELPEESTNAPQIPSPTRPKRARIESDDEEDLEGFIVKDSYQKEITRKKKKEDSNESESDIESEEDVEAEIEPIPDDDGEDLTKVLQDEAARLTANLTSTVVGGRALRDRSKIVQPKDTYWEKYGKSDYQKLLVKDEKKDFLDELRSLKKEYERNPEDFGDVPSDFRWPSVTMRDSIEAIKAAHQYVSDALQIEYTDDDDEEEEEEDSDEDEETPDEDSESEDEETESEEEESEEEDEE